ncbi:hypothetical protein LY76DRAFT_295128 [Colletotrichum caudatum]|nr:hypothetical protein LY76DRAFT_295128 [Colletotrichum caudatum]
MACLVRAHWACCRACICPDFRMKSLFFVCLLSFICAPSLHRGPFSPYIHRMAALKCSTQSSSLTRNSPPPKLMLLICHACHARRKHHPHRHRNGMRNIDDIHSNPLLQK